MPADTSDDTERALAVLRGLPAERAAEEAEERDAVPEPVAMQAARAMGILEHRREWALEDRRALGLPPSVGSDGWSAVVRGRLTALEPGVVLDAWFDLVEAREGGRTMAVAVDAFTRLVTIAPLVDRLRSLLRDGGEDVIRRVKEAIVAAEVPIDDVLLRLVRDLLVDPSSSRETATAALVIAGELARREPAVAAMMAERIRADRGLWRHEVHLAHSAPPKTADNDAAARAVERSGCASLAATAMLQLEERGTGDPRWARALAAVGGDQGGAHLVRMRGRPGWSELAPAIEPSQHELDSLVSPIADVRRRALDRLVAEPRPEHLRALLLAAELDRYVVREQLRLPWTRPRPTQWLRLLASHEKALRLDRRLAELPRGVSELGDALAATSAEHLLVDLIDAGAAHAPMTFDQELTPALRELEMDGAAAFAQRHIPDPRLTAEELATLDEAEAQLAASASRWWG